MLETAEGMKGKCTTTSSEWYVHTKSNFIFSRQQPNLRSLHNYKKNKLLVSSVRRVELLAGLPGELFKSSTRRLSLEARTARCTVEAYFSKAVPGAWAAS